MKVFKKAFFKKSEIEVEKLDHYPFVMSKGNKNN